MTTPTESGPAPLLHQINNQLGIIMGLCDLMLYDTSSTDACHRDIDAIRAAAEDTLELVTDLMAPKP